MERVHEQLGSAPLVPLCDYVSNSDRAGIDSVLAISAAATAACLPCSPRKAGLGGATGGGVQELL